MTNGGRNAAVFLIRKKNNSYDEGGTCIRSPAGRRRGTLGHRLFCLYAVIINASKPTVMQVVPIDYTF